MVQHILLDKVSQCIEREKLAEAGQHIYVAVSGGADSVALLTALYLLGYKVSILHCNFQLRGLESERDEAFVRSLAQKLDISLEVQSYDTQSYAEQHGLSIEMAARELRYDWFAKALQRGDNIRVAIAHNLDDTLETFLINLSKGTGLRGLSGMPYIRSGGLIRPMLDVSRAEVEDFLSYNSLENDHVEDSSNTDIIYQRNYIRHHLLPDFAPLNSNYRYSMGQTIKHLRGAEAFYRESIERYKELVLKDRRIDINALLQSPDAETLLFEILKPYGFTGIQCYDIGKNLQRIRSGATYYSSNYRLVCSWNVLELLPLNTNTFSPIIIDLKNTPTIVRLSGRYELSIRIVHQLGDLNNSNTLYIPLDRLQERELCLRKPETGERIRPFGMQRGSKKLSRILIEAKATQQDRDDAIVLSVGDETFWLIGWMKSERTRLKQDEQGPFLALSRVTL